MTSSQSKACEDQSKQFMRWISAAYARTPTDESAAAFLKTGKYVEPNHGFTPEIMIDPDLNCPQQIFQTSVADLQTLVDEKVDFKTWHPDLRLTDEEAEIGLGKDSNVVLGRSGTGKTVCVIARIIRDSERWQESRLFVARSKKLRDHVLQEVERREADTTCKLNDAKMKAMNVGGADGSGTVFATIDEFTSSIARKLYDSGAIGRLWRNDKKVSFSYFQRTVWPANQCIVPLATENLLENTIGCSYPRQRSLGAAACPPPSSAADVRAVLMTSSHAEGRPC